MSTLPSDAAMPGLAAMFAQMERAPPIVKPSAYWEALNRRSLDLLSERGFAEFKRTVNRNYFSWRPRTPLDDQVRALVRDALRRRAPWPMLGAAMKDLGEVDFLRHAWQRRLHAVFLTLLWEYVRARDRYRLLDRLEEPSLGGPVTVEHRHRRISQDLCNSVFEVCSMLEGRPTGSMPARVIELGAGYGRVAWVMLEAFPGVRCLLVDIPPALAVAQRYLTELFPDRPTFHFRSFTDGRTVADELAQAHIAFLTPDQLEMLPSLEADLFVNISSLHEMRPDQIAYYLTMVDRHCVGHFYTKQWSHSVNAHDGLVIRREDYPIPDHWTEIYSRQHPIQTLFFEALYCVGG